jgi:hypothetical protein
MVMSRVSAWAAAALSANQTGANHVTHDRLRNLDHLLRDEHPRPLRGFKQSSLALVHACRKAGSLTALAAPLAVMCPGTGSFCLQPRAIGPP